MCYFLSLQIREVQNTVNAKEKEYNRLQEEEKALDASFLEQVAESKFKDFLLKVFRKKIKRAKKEVKATGTNLSVNINMWAIYVHMCICDICSTVHKFHAKYIP